MAERLKLDGGAEWIAAATAILEGLMDMGSCALHDRLEPAEPHPGKRSGAELPSANNSLEPAAVPAAVPPLMMSPG
jgi:hypothetical protein